MKGYYFILVKKNKNLVAFKIILHFSVFKIRIALLFNDTFYSWNLTSFSIKILFKYLHVGNSKCAALSILDLENSYARR